MKQWALWFFLVALPVGAQAPAALPEPDPTVAREGSIAAIASMPDGGAVVVGDFSSVNGVARQNIWRVGPGAELDPSWIARVDGPISAVVVNADNNVYIAGQFTTVDGEPRAGLARLDGDDGAVTPWSAPAFEGGLVHDLAVDDEGRLYAGGIMTVSGAVSYLVRFDVGGRHDATWPAAGAPDAEVHAIALGAGGVFIGGSFRQIGGQARSRVAKLVRESGALLDYRPDPDAVVFDIAVDEDEGYVYLAGDFTLAGRAASRAGRRGLARTDAEVGLVDSGWDAEPDQMVTAVRPHAGNVYVAGHFGSIGGGIQPRVARLSVTDAALDSAWAPAILGPFDTVRAIAPLAGQTLVGGTFTTVSEQTRLSLVLLEADGAPGDRIDAERPGKVSTIVPDGIGGMWIAGDFLTVDGVARKHVAKLLPDGQVDALWRADASAEVSALLRDAAAGQLVLGGAFRGIGEVAVKHLARVSEATGLVDQAWSPNPTGPVNALLRDPQGRLYAGGEFDAVGDAGDIVSRSGLVRFTGDGRVDLGWIPPSAHVRSMAVCDQYLVAGGDFWLAKYALADAQPVAAFGDHPSGRIDAVQCDDASIFIGGDFVFLRGASANGIAKLHHDGSVDTTFDAGGTAHVHALLLESDRVFVGGSFPRLGGASGNRFVAWLDRDSGAAHSAWAPSPDGEVHAVTRTDAGRVAIGGDFLGVAAARRPGLAVLDRLPQQVTFEPYTHSPVFGATPPAVLASSSSALPVRFATNTPGTCEIHPVTGHWTTAGAGVCTLVAEQSGDADWQPAEPASLSVTIARASQPLFRVTATPARLLSGEAATLTTNGVAGGTVSYRIAHGAAHCNLEGDRVLAVTQGECTIEGTHSGDANHEPAAAQATIEVSDVADALPFTDGFED